MFELPRQKEFELDALIKSLIDYPSKTAAPTIPDDDAKRNLKTRIAEVTTLVNTLCEQLKSLEYDSEARQNLLKITVRLR